MVKKAFADKRGDYSFEKSVRFARIELHFPAEFIDETRSGILRIADGYWREALRAEGKEGGMAVSAFEHGNHAGGPIDLMRVDLFVDRVAKLFDHRPLKVEVFVCSTLSEVVLDIPEGSLENRAAELRAAGYKVIAPNET